jgi:hypothetical protein
VRTKLQRNCTFILTKSLYNWVVTFASSFYPLATVDLGDSEGDLASPLDPPAPSPPASLRVMARGGELGPSAGGHV